MGEAERGGIPNVEHPMSNFQGERRGGEGEERGRGRGKGRESGW